MSPTHKGPGGNMIISAIVACGRSNRVIGAGNQLLWHISGDLRRFKEITMNHHILMGRKTFESIGRPLPGRKMMVLTRDKNFKVDGVDTVHSVDDAIELALQREESEFIICGGAEIYSQTIDRVEKIYLTEVDYEGEGDAYFPHLDDSQWVVEREDKAQCGEKDQYSWVFKILNRSIGKLIKS